MRGMRISWLGAEAFTLLLLVMIALSTGGISQPFFYVLLLVVLIGVAFFLTLFPGSRFFVIALANSLAVYACIYTFFIETNFAAASAPVRSAAFVLPILSFLAGALWRRDEIRSIVESHRLPEARHFGRVFAWIVPLILVGALTFLFGELQPDRTTTDVILTVAMGTIALLMLFVSRDICTFLLDTGLLFEDFFRRVAGLMIPAFAFFTFYSLAIIVFACLYRMIDLYGVGVHFTYEGEPHSLTFTEALYFSIVTLSTVGYGDLAPQSTSVRAVVSVQMVSGVFLLLFGFSEIMRFMQEGRRTLPRRPE